jgi:hypothetical protein
MKLRIRGNFLRFRLTKTEAGNLAETGLVEEKTDFGGGEYLSYSVSASVESKIVTAEFFNGRLEVSVPAGRVKLWAGSNEVGISATQDSLKILIEKDYNCLTSRSGDEDADTFPNPT